MSCEPGWMSSWICTWRSASKACKFARIQVRDPSMAISTKFDVIINLKTAKALDLAAPPNLLAIADK